MPQNKPMKIQWITVNGRQVPLVLPQTYSYADDDWKVTSDRDPLPIVEYGTTEGGVIVPKRVSDEGHELTQLTGSIVQNDYLHNVIIPEGTTVDVPIEEFKSKRISLGILFVEISRFSFRTISRGADSWMYLDSIAHDTQEGRRNISELELRTKRTTVRIENKDDKDITIDYLTITEFIGGGLRI